MAVVGEVEADGQAIDRRARRGTTTAPGASRRLVGTGLPVTWRAHSEAGRRARDRHAIRFARLAARSHRSSLRHEVLDRDLSAGAQARLRLLRLSVLARRHARWPL